MISVSATIARSWTVRPLPANHRCLTSHVASVSSKVMSAYHIPVAGPGKHAQADFRAAYRDISGQWPRAAMVTASLLVTLWRVGGSRQMIAHDRRAVFLGRAGTRRAAPFGDHGTAVVPGRGQLEPVEPVAGQRQQVGKLADPRENHAAHAFHRRDAGEPAQVELDRLREPG